MDKIVPKYGKATVAVPANAKIAVFTRGSATISQQVGYPNEPTSLSVLSNLVNSTYTSSAFTSATNVVIESGYSDVYYAVGTDAAIQQLMGPKMQGAPVAVDATGAVSNAAIFSGIVTSSTAAAVAGTLPTGTVLDAGSSIDIGDAFDWSVIVTGGTNDFTVTAASGHTIVGAAVVTHSTSGRFRTRKTAANTFITYRLS